MGGLLFSFAIYFTIPFLMGPPIEDIFIKTNEQGGTQRISRSGENALEKIKNQGIPFFAKKDYSKNWTYNNNNWLKTEEEQRSNNTYSSLSDQMTKENNAYSSPFGDQIAKDNYDMPGIFITETGNIFEKYRDFIFPIQEFMEAISIEGNRYFSHAMEDEMVFFQGESSFDDISFLGNSLLGTGRLYFEDNKHEIAINYFLAGARLFQMLALGVNRPSDSLEGILALEGERTALTISANILSQGDLSPAFLGRIVESYSMLELTRPKYANILQGERIKAQNIAKDTRKYRPLLWIKNRLLKRPLNLEHSLWIKEIERLAKLPYKKLKDEADSKIWIAQGEENYKNLTKVSLKSPNFLLIMQENTALGRACALICALRVQGYREGFFPKAMPHELEEIKDPFTDKSFEWNIISSGRWATLYSPWLDMIKTPGAGDDHEWKLTLPQP